MRMDILKDSAFIKTLLATFYRHLSLLSPVFGMYVEKKALNQIIVVQPLKFGDG